MTEWRKAVSVGKRDDSEPEVVEAFELGGASVWRLSGKDVPDLAVGYLGESHLVEVKTGNAPLKPGQRRSFDAWRGEPIQIARTGPQATKLLRVWEVAAARRPATGGGGSWAAAEEHEEALTAPLAGGKADDAPP